MEEYLHRDEKDIKGVGQAQARSPKSVAPQPVFAVAAYRILLLAGLLELGRERTDAYLRLPKWRKRTPNAPRSSI